MPVTIVLTATIKPNWHLYATDLPAGGPTPTHLLVDKISGAELVGKLTSDTKPIEKYDPNFEMNLRFFSGKVTFRQKIRITDPTKFAFEGAIGHMACDDERCLSPSNWDFSVQTKDLGKLAGAAPTATAESQAPQAPTPIMGEPSADSTTSAPDTLSANQETAQGVVSDLWAPVIPELKAYGDKELQEAKDMLTSLGAGDLIGRKYHGLSQGEKQICLIARSLMEDPDIIILDEATVGLDLFAREKLLRQIDRITSLPHAPLVLYVTHHAEEITDKMSHILLLRRGKIVAQGPKKDIITPQVLENFYESPVNIISIDDKRFFIKPQV